MQNAMEMRKKKGKKNMDDVIYEWQTEYCAAFGKGWKYIEIKEKIKRKAKAIGWGGESPNTGRRTH